MLKESSCLNCKAILYESSEELRQPCPVCGGISRLCPESVEDTLYVFDGLRMKGKRGGVGRPYFDVRSGASYFRATGQWHHLERLIDHENDRYVETIRVLLTGELLSHVDEPLSEHLGHGSDKSRQARQS